MHALLFAAMIVTQPATYPKSQMLIEAADVAKLPAGACTILDVRPEKDYLAGHVPKAVSVNVAELSKAFYTVTDPAALGEMLGKIGIDPKEPIVIYGDDVRQSARCWFLLRSWSLTAVRLLNGGWLAWKESGGQVSTEKEQLEPMLVKAMLDKKRFAVKEFVLNAIKDKSAQILDARSENEFCGEAGAAKRRGAIPGAVHLEWSKFIDVETQRFKPASEISKLLKDAGIDSGKPTVTY